MEIRSVQAQTKIETPRIEKKAINVKKAEAKEVRKQSNVRKAKFNDMKIKGKQIKSSSEAKVKIKEVKEQMKQKESLKVMDRVDTIRDKALATLS
ncbi:MAG: hypothetical protein MJ244_00925 [Clostridia bacterium]|nr:hypothetical protein [Clostridia bacterium]